MSGYRRDEAKAAARASFRGVWAAITTPFDDSGRVDLAALRSDLDRLVEELRVDGVFCTGVMSEFWALSVAERRQMVEAVVSAVAGRCGVIAHTGHHSITETVELTRHAQQVGADFAVVINPYYPPAEDEGLYAWYRELCSQVEIGVWLFDTSYSGLALSPALVDRLADIDNICGIKVGHGHARYLETVGLVGDRILVCEPDEGSFLEDVRDHGAQVFMSSAAPYLYQLPGWLPMHDYVRLALAGDFEGAARLSATLQPVREVAARWITGPWSRDRVNPLPAIKAWAGLLGMAGGPVRPPLPQLGPQRVAALAAELAATPLGVAVAADSTAASTG